MVIYRSGVEGLGVENKPKWKVEEGEDKNSDGGGSCGGGGDWRGIIEVEVNYRGGDIEMGLPG